MVRMLTPGRSSRITKNSGYRSATKRAGGETDHQQREEDKEKNLRDRGGGASYGEKSKKPGDKRQNQKGQ